MYTEDFTVLVMVLETAGLFDDVISAYVFGLPDSEKVCRSCAALWGQSDHNFDKFGNEILLWQKLAQESSENEGVQAKCAFAGY